MFLRNYLIQRDLSIQKTIAKKENYFLTMHDYIMKQHLQSEIKQYFPVGSFVSVSFAPFCVGYTLTNKPDALERVLKVMPRDIDGVMILPRRGNYGKTIALIPRNDSPVLEAVFVENENVEVSVKYFKDDIPFEDIMREVRIECDRLWPTLTLYDKFSNKSMVLKDKQLPQIVC